VTSTEDSTTRLQGRIDEIDKAKGALTHARDMERRAQARIDWLRKHSGQRVEVRVAGGRQYDEGKELVLTVRMDGYRADHLTISRVGDVLRDVIGAELFGAACEAQKRLAAEHRSAVEAVAAAEAELVRIAGRPLAEAA
jgi:hypothetical protein